MRGSTTRFPRSTRNNILIEKATGIYIYIRRISNFPPLISILRSLRRNDVSPRWKGRRRREEGKMVEKISNRVLNWSIRWPGWKLHTFFFVTRVTEAYNTPVSLYSSLSSWCSRVFEQFYYIEYHFTLETILFIPAGGPFSIRNLSISNREI